MDKFSCEFCGRLEEKATRDNLEGLTWLWPDEKWICTSCLKRQSINNGRNKTR
jgi:hypothetical protein